MSQGKEVKQPRNFEDKHDDKKRRFKGHWEHEKHGFVKMYFSEPATYNDIVLYPGGEPVDVPKNMVERWQKRGAQLVLSPKDLEKIEQPKQDKASEEADLEVAEKPEQDQKVKTSSKK